MEFYKQLARWQQQLRGETTDQAEVIDIIEKHERSVQSEALRARAGVPEEVWSSQLQALRQCNGLLCFTDYARASRIRKAGCQSPVHERAAAGTAHVEWWNADSVNLFKWHVDQARPAGA